MSGRLDRSELERLFQAASDELRRRGQRGHVYIIGGAAMSMSFDARRTTHDVDARICSGHGPVMDAARKVGRREGLPESWLNEQATMYMPSTPDTAAPVVYSSPSLVITGASAEHILAMKLESGRPGDVEDIETLVGMLKLAEYDEAEEIHRKTFPGGRIREIAKKTVKRAIQTARKRAR